MAPSVWTIDPKGFFPQDSPLSEWRQSIYEVHTVLPLSLSISPPTIGAQALHKMAEKTFKVLNTFFVSDHGRFLPFPVSGIRSHRPLIASAATA